MAQDMHTFQLSLYEGDILMITSDGSERDINAESRNFRGREVIFLPVYPAPFCQSNIPAII